MQAGGLEQSSDQRTLGGLRSAFELPEDIAFFNTANMAAQLRSVRRAGEAALQRRSAPWTISSEDWFADVEVLRQRFAQVVGGESDCVAIIPATSYGIAIAARCLEPRARERIIVLAEEYPSGIYTWRATQRRTDAEIVTVHREPGQTWADAVLANLDERVAVVSVPNVHWTDGALVDLAQIAPAARAAGAALVLDASQSAGAMPLDVHELRPDFVVTVGYKWLLGPFSVGYLYAAEQHHGKAPLEENWISRAGSEDFARLVDYRDEYQPGARRFDVGQRTNFMLTPMATAALTQILGWGVANIATSLRAVTDRIATRAAEIGLTSAPASQRGPHLLGLKLPDSALAQVLPALAEARCYAAVRGSSLRISPHLHTGDADIDRLIAALGRALEP